MRLTRTALLLLACAAPLAAQRDSSAAIRGVVTDSGGRPINGAEVYIVTHGRTTRSDAAGRFAFTQILVGPVQVQARLPGYFADDTSFALGSGETRDIRLHLTRFTSLDTVRVVNYDDCPTKTLEGFECRRRGGNGVFRNRAELAAMNASFLGDFFVGVPGIRRLGGEGLQSTTKWRCLKMIFDGQRNVPLPNIRPADIVGMEFYDDFEKVPAWYRTFAIQPPQYKRVPMDHKSGAPGIPVSPSMKCSLIVYWTKFASKYDPGLDQNRDVQRTRRPPL